jgi:hypothetical protein
MLSVGDELLISGLDPDTKAAVERYADATAYDRCDSFRKPSPELLRREYERGFQAGAAVGRRPKETAE